MHKFKIHDVRTFVINLNEKEIPHNNTFIYLTLQHLFI